VLLIFQPASWYIGEAFVLPAHGLLFPAHIPVVSQVTAVEPRVSVSCVETPNSYAVAHWCPLIWSQFSEYPIKTKLSHLMWKATHTKISSLWTKIWTNVHQSCIIPALDLSHLLSISVNGKPSNTEIIFVQLYTISIQLIYAVEIIFK